ncbi:glycosyltransferase family 90 protein [Truncatella angustata]|uniref:Glycosyltransferase family 90 protein n=1 Tax=Truncatella angustata TaxID=152316 RepID=A0A9P8UMK4_9PEZI|nr:glycosyltransferase family 90 protein [Truncatella angustata]KAH6654811.1 glycosyltransferase family 90 protein [Truncatella angustata]
MLSRFRPWHGLPNLRPRLLVALGSYSLVPAVLILLDEPTSNSHPIDDLVLDAGRTHDLLLTQRSTKIGDAAAKYRTRRGRHPPPGFDKWFEYAMRHNAIVVEQFFDRIEHDIRPFWATEARLTAYQASTWDNLVRVRDGKAYSVGDGEDRVPWLGLWASLIAEAAEFLPDVDMPINYMDETRVLVKWEEINELVKASELNKKITPPTETIQDFKGLDDLDIWSAYASNPEWITKGAPKYWNLTRLACAPESPARNTPALEDYSQRPIFPSDWNPSYSQNGFVKNFTAASDPCLQPHLRGLHGTFVEQITMSTTQSLIPLFSGCKLPMNNAILIPGAMYLTDDARYSGGNSHGSPWILKKDGIVWRGVASGGRHKKENWTHFQRLRLVQMLNGTTVSGVEQRRANASTFEMPSTPYNISIDHEGHIGEWLRGISDVGFVDLLCFPRDDCSYLTPYFSQVDVIPMEEQFKQKYIPDIDGNSFSARFRSLLLSTSLPLKSTIYAEWHDDRLLPWLHFVPLDNTLQDLYAVLNYFTKDKKGDTAAQYIAESGKAWSERVLRHEDMLLYVWRLLLEFARVCDENRERLGFVEDLT